MPRLAKHCGPAERVLNVRQFRLANPDVIRMERGMNPAIANGQDDLPSCKIQRITGDQA
jgi:hypothetical protein